MNNITFDQAKRYGFNFPGARAWYDPRNVEQLAADAALTTDPNTLIPAEFTAYIDPAVVDILTSPTRAREMFTETRKGDFTTSHATWRARDFAGRTQPYSDTAANGSADVNNNWLKREQYRFQTIIEYGDLETEMAGVAKIELAADKQRAAATVLDTDANSFYLRGVAGREIYGLLNDPNLPPAISALPAGIGNSPLWTDKGTKERYNDVLALFAELARQSAGIITRNTPLLLVLSPDMEVMLAGATDFNVSVLDMLQKYFRDLVIVALPELADNAAGETMFMAAKTVNGMQTAELGFGLKAQAGRMVPELSSMKQKWVASTYGGIVLMPFAFAQMTGM